MRSIQPCFLLRNIKEVIIMNKTVVGAIVTIIVALGTKLIEEMFKEEIKNLEDNK